MNIIICGLKGTGKTTLSKILAKKYNLCYINDYEIGVENEEKIVNFINNHDNYVYDLCYSLSPRSCLNVKNAVIYFLGFVSIDEKILYNLMKNKGKMINFEQIKQLRSKSLLFCQECKKYNLPFYDVNKDRQKIINEILEEIDKRRRKYANT